MTRRQWIPLAALGAASVAAYPTLLEPHWLELTNTHIRFGQGEKEPIRVLHLSDLHASFFVPLLLLERSIGIGLEQQPDLVCLTGDFITYRSDFDVEAYVQVLRKLTRALPVFAVLGNHDGGKWAQNHRGCSDHELVESILRRSGIKLLHNKSEVVRIKDRDLSIVGVADLWSDEIDGEAAFAETDREMPTVLLAHNPDSKAKLKDYKWDLMLSGHTHGGQVLIPFQGPRYAPVQDKRYVAGLKSWRDRRVYVTRGVGNLGGVRFRCRPEVTMLTLT